MVTYPADGRTADDLMISADQAMYASKRRGKNRIVGYRAPATSGPHWTNGTPRSGPGPSAAQEAAAGVAAGPPRSPVGPV